MTSPVRTAVDTAEAPVRVLIYVRISEVEAQRHRATAGIERQEAECRAHLDKWFGKGGWILVRDGASEVFSDNRHSATSGKPRPAYLRALKACELGMVDCVVAWATDRFYRVARDLCDIIDVFSEAGVNFRVVRQEGPIDLSTAAGRLVARAVGAVNQFEGEMKAERIQAQIRQVIYEGSAPATAPRYGYRRINLGRGCGSTLEIVPHEAAIIQLAAKRILAGCSLGEVAVELNGAGHRNRNGLEWTSTKVQRMVESPIVAGLTILKGEVVGKGNWEPILDKLTWERVVAELTDPQRYHYRRRTDYWLRGQRQPRGDGNGLYDVYGAPLVGGRQAATAKWPEGRRIYRTPKVTIDAIAVERFCLEMVGDSIDLIEFMLPGDTDDDSALRAAEAEVDRVERQLAALAEARFADELLPVEYQAARVRLMRELEAAKAAAPAARRNHRRVPVRDVAKRWRLPVEKGGLSDWERQEIVRVSLGPTTVLPGGDGRPADDEAMRARLQFRRIEL